MNLTNLVSALRRPGEPRVKFWKVSDEQYVQLCEAQQTYAPIWNGRPAIRREVCRRGGAKAAFFGWKCEYANEHHTWLNSP